MIAAFVATYGAVFLAEIAGDKLLYTTGVLSARYRPLPIMVGVILAFMLKMAAAVLLGTVISRLPPVLVAAVTSVSFLGVAFVVWRKPLVPRTKKKRDDTAAGKAAIVSFAAIFFSEWGDVGQITAAAMAARFPTPGATFPWVVWSGAVLAMVTKGALAASIGAGVRRWIEKTFSPKVIRWGGVGLLLLFGLLSVIETLTEGHA